MMISATMVSELPIDQALAEANREAFEGEIRLTDVQDNLVHACRPGTEAYVGTDTARTQDHDTLKAIVARRHSRSGI